MLEEVIKEVDICITDSMYTAEEYPKKWAGDMALTNHNEMADRVDAGKIILTTRTNPDRCGVDD